MGYYLLEKLPTKPNIYIIYFIGIEFSANNSINN